MNSKKDLEFTLENDLTKREITITLLPGHNSITLPEAWVYMLINQLKDHIHEWKRLR
ncbi:hypothetical protein EDD70_1043 [Hydrogenoanaerobacterium saccharovorans]|uniref:Uncharacterized protein n=1 Tax=Hydrogenoanaerobacterium saccharovorans TaxID=474960 RepID=A0A1H8A173_9FIRM|nr:hypothetical protein EDD70_1043 [Hydrogenoanaerobacterium saccharovorans]SEM64460.1 hypothetical protein SAMN05216180_1048 [Hydrogenoanaerobacterium saccharovorans]